MKQHKSLLRSLSYLCNHAMGVCMNYVACNCCPTPLDCGFDKKCWNQRVTQANLREIHTELAKYDAMVAAKPVWAPDVQVKPAKPYCGHLRRSEVGICLACGDWT